MSINLDELQFGIILSSSIVMGILVFLGMWDFRLALIGSAIFMGNIFVFGVVFPMCGIEERPI